MSKKNQWTRFIDYHEIKHDKTLKFENKKDMDIHQRMNPKELIKHSYR